MMITGKGAGAVRPNLRNHVQSLRRKMGTYTASIFYEGWSSQIKTPLRDV